MREPNLVSVWKSILDFLREAEHWVAGQSRTLIVLGKPGRTGVHGGTTPGQGVSFVDVTVDSCRSD